MGKSPSKEGENQSLVNEDGEPICGRPCENGSPCQRVVPLLSVACPAHRADEDQLV